VAWSVSEGERDRQGSEREQDERDAELSAVALSLHREWDSPGLWPAIATRAIAIDAESHASPAPRTFGRWPALAAAALIAVTLGPTSWLGWRSFMIGPQTDLTTADERRQRLLSEDALAAIERSEAQYIKAIDELTRLTAPRLDMPDSPLLVNLRERLEVIDAAIAEYRAEIARNRFNAHLRRQLLWIYQEKRRTLEQVQEYADAL
jgi:hypothetical protein